MRNQNRVMLIVLILGIATLVSGASARAGWDLGNATIAQWRMNDGGDGDVIRDSVKACHGFFADPTGTGALSQHSCPGKIGGALEFDGVDDRMVVPDYAALDLGSAFALSFWIRNDRPACPGNAVIIGKSSTGTGKTSWDVVWDGGSHCWSVAVSAGISASTQYAFDAVVTTGTWHHVVVVYDDSAGNGQRFQLFQDGQSLFVSLVESDMGGAPLGNDLSVFIGAGRNKYGVADFFDGALDDIRVFNRALTLDEISGLYAGGDGTEARRATLAFDSDPLSKAIASEYTAYSATLVNDISGANSLAPVYFTKISGPAWLSIGVDGGLSGTPARRDIGINTWVIQVSDSAGNSVRSTLEIEVGKWNLTGAVSAYWPMDDISQTTSVIEVVAGRDGILQDPTGNPIVADHITSGVVCNGLVFDGEDDFVLVPDADVFDGGSSFTLAFWCRLSDPRMTKSVVLASKSDLDADEFSWYVMWRGANQDFELVVGDGEAATARYRFAYCPTVGEWHHVVVIYNDEAGQGQRFHLLIDGNNVGVSSVVIDTGGLPAANGYPLALGASLDDGVYDKFVQGSFDDVRFFSRSLTPSEVAGLFASGVGTHTASSSAHMPAPVLTGITLRDHDPFQNVMPQSLTNETSVSVFLVGAENWVEGVLLAEDSDFASNLQSLFRPPLGWYDGGTSLSYRLNPGDGERTVWAVLNNEVDTSFPPTSGTIRLDTVSPLASIASAQAMRTDAPSLTASVNFSEDVHGFSGNGFAIGGVGGTVSSITGSGADYNVVVIPDGEGTVTLQVTAGAAWDAAGNPSTPSGVLTRVCGPSRVIVDGQTVCTIGAAYSLLDRNDGIADIIDVVVGTTEEPLVVTISGTDDLVINGDATANGACKMVVAGAHSAFAINPASGASYRVCDLVIVPKYADGDKTVSSPAFGYTPPNNLESSSVVIENVTVTASSSGDEPVAVAQSYNAANATWFSSFICDQARSGLIDVSFTFSNCKFAHNADGILRLRNTQAAFEMNVNDCVLTNSNYIGIVFTYVAQVTLNLRRTELSHLNRFAIYLEHVHASESRLNLLPGTRIFENALDGIYMTATTEVGPLRVTLRGTAEEPVELSRNGRNGIYIKSPINPYTLHFGPLEHVILAENVSRGIVFELNGLPHTDDSYVGPFDHVLFSGNATQVAWDGISDFLTTFTNCTFADPAGLYQQGMDTATSLTAVYRDSIFTGHDDTRGAIAIWGGCVGSKAIFENCAMVTSSQSSTDGMLYQSYISAAAATNGCYIEKIACIDRDPLYLGKSTDPFEPNSFDVNSPVYAGCASNGGNLSGWGDYVGAFREVAIVDGVGNDSGTYATISEGYASLDRGNGVPDYINVTAEKIWETAATVVSGADDLVIDGDVDGNGRCVVVVPGGQSGFILAPDSETSYTIRNFVLIPRYADGDKTDTTPAFDYQLDNYLHDSRILVENVLVTASSENDEPVGLREPFEIAYSSWYHGFRQTSYLKDRQNVKITLKKCDFSHHLNACIQLWQCRARIEINLDECVLTNGLLRGINMSQVKAVTVNVRRTEVSNFPFYGILISDVLDSETRLNVLEGTQVSQNPLDGLHYTLSSSEYAGHVTIQGTREEPVVFSGNGRYGLCVSSETGEYAMQLGPVEYAVFTGNAFSGFQMDLQDYIPVAGSNLGPFQKCLFAGNGTNIVWRAKDLATTFTSCTVADPVNRYSCVIRQSENSSLDWVDSVLTGPSDTRGGVYIWDSSFVDVSFAHCALVTKSQSTQDGMEFQYLISTSIPGVGNHIAQANCINIDPMYASKQWAPLTPASFDVQNPQYAAAATNDTPLAGYGDYVGPYPARFFETGKVTAVAGDWVPVQLGRPYGSPVIVCTAVIEDGMPPAVVRMRNVSSQSFEVCMQNPSGNVPSSTVIQYLAMESGAWTLPDGTHIEAVRLNSLSPCVDGNWSTLVPYTYMQHYLAPVVLGQVMTSNDSQWSVFACAGPGGLGGPTADGCTFGRHIGEDRNQGRASETLGVIILESTSRGIIGDVDFRTFVGPTNVRAIGDAPPYSYAHDLGVAPEVAIMTQAGQRAYDGAWAGLYGSQPLTDTAIHLALDEDQIGDPERTHCAESVGGFVAVSHVSGTLWNVGNQPPYFLCDPIKKRTAAVGWPYALSLSGDACDPDSDDYLVFSKVSGPEWLTVAEDGSLGGTPGLEDVEGGASFLVRVEDRRGAYDIATLIIPVSATSLTMGTTVSPAWFEGRTPVGAVGVHAYASDGTSVTVVREDQNRWYLDNASQQGAPRGVLLQDGVPVAITLVAVSADGSVSSLTQEFCWEPIDVFGFEGSTITLRRGDSLLLTAVCEGALLEIDTNGDGIYDLSGIPAAKFPVTFSEAGAFLVKARVDGENTATLPVLVLDAAISGPIACQKDYKREKTASVYPAGKSSNLTFVAADTELMNVTEMSCNGSTVGLILQPLTTGTLVLQSRLGAVDGPILSESVVNAFEIQTGLFDYVKTIGNLEDGTRVVENDLKMVPWVGAVDFHFHIFSVGATFANSSIDLEVSSDLFTEDGTFIFHVLAMHDSICMWCKIYQDGVIVGELH